MESTPPSVVAVRPTNGNPPPIETTCTEQQPHGHVGEEQHQHHPPHLPPTDHPSAKERASIINRLLAPMDLDGDDDDDDGVAGHYDLQSDALHEQEELFRRGISDEALVRFRDMIIADLLESLLSALMKIASSLNRDRCPREFKYKSGSKADFIDASHIVGYCSVRCLCECLCEKGTTLHSKFNRIVRSLPFGTALMLQAYLRSQSDLQILNDIYKDLDNDTLDEDGGDFRNVVPQHSNTNHSWDIPIDNVIIALILDGGRCCDSDVVYRIQETYRSASVMHSPIMRCIIAELIGDVEIPSASQEGQRSYMYVRVRDRPQPSQAEIIRYLLNRNAHLQIHQKLHTEATSDLFCSAITSAIEPHHLSDGLDALRTEATAACAEALLGAYRRTQETLYAEYTRGYERIASDLRGGPPLVDYVSIRGTKRRIYYFGGIARYYYAGHQRRLSVPVAHHRIQQCREEQLAERRSA